MKKMIYIVLLIIGIFPFAMLFWITGSARKLDKNDYKKYLIDTYGDLEFEYVSNESCNWFNIGSCTYYFTTPELNGKTFSVEGSFGGEDENGEDEKLFEDDYIKTKYDSNLKQYYNTYFSHVLKNGIEFKSINLDYEYTYNIPNMSFDNYLKYIKDKNTEITLKLNIKLDENNKYFNIKTKDKSFAYEKLEKASQELNKFIYNNYDINNLKKEVNNILISNNLNNIKRVLIYFDGCQENVYYASCSETIELYSE